MKTVLLDTLVKKYNPKLLLSVLPTSYCLPHWIKNRAPLVIFPLGAGMVKSLKYHRLFTNSYPLFCLGKNALLPIYICSIAWKNPLLLPKLNPSLLLKINKSAFSKSLHQPWIDGRAPSKLQLIVSLLPYILECQEIVITLNKGRFQQATTNIKHVLKIYISIPVTALFHLFRLVCAKADQHSVLNMMMQGEWCLYHLDDAKKVACIIEMVDLSIA